AWTLKTMTDSLGAKLLIAEFVRLKATAVIPLLPAIVFLIGVGLSFATGTSWGTFGILIPIMLEVFPGGSMMVISIAACLAGSVCGDHCSPISDTTIMASAGAQCNHVNHVSTQLPYVMVVALVSCIGYALIGILYATNNIGLAWLSLPVSIIILLASLVFIKKRVEGKRV
ncbi:MAG: Na+/H+ antiporter NhaC family protein, partial [Lachnospiraceae bacterium]|nr:Na+/H+ antiporter NhaC family protein [Lachnospiraceae bacterium]